MSFSLDRKEGFPTQFKKNPTAVTVDILEAGFIAAFIIILIAFYISAITREVPQTIYRYVRITLLLSIGLILLLSNFGQEWEVSELKTRTAYKAGSSVIINATVGIKIGLRGVNVTLQAPSHNEQIDYNERFEWTWDQGRFGFGPYSGHLQRSFRQAQYRGTPTPILWIIDYFIIDGEGFRYGRFYRTAGWYCHISLWSAFACWLLAVVLFRSVVLYGAYLLSLSALLQLFANFLWAVIRNPLEMTIHFEDGSLTTKFGSTYWLTLISALLSLTVAITVIILDVRCHQYLYYTIFGVDPLNSYDEIAYLKKSDQIRDKKPSETLEMMSRNTENDDEYVAVYRRNSMFRPPVLRHKKPKLVNMA